jgi:hypothetical protein
MAIRDDVKLGPCFGGSDFLTADDSHRYRKNKTDFPCAFYCKEKNYD